MEEILRWCGVTACHYREKMGKSKNRCLLLNFEPIDKPLLLNGNNEEIGRIWIALSWRGPVIVIPRALPSATMELRFQREIRPVWFLEQ